MPSVNPLVFSEFLVVVATLSEIAPETAFTGDEWIRQATHPLLTHK
jgi:hypothetical protein